MTELGAFLLPVVPLLFLLVALLLGRYPGCEAIVRLSERIAARRRRPRAARPRSGHRRAPTHAAHGGLLLALGLCGRAPPLRS
jgi:hypothetical protein